MVQKNQGKTEGVFLYEEKNRENLGNPEGVLDERGGIQKIRKRGKKQKEKATKKELQSTRKKGHKEGDQKRESLEEGTLTSRTGTISPGRTKVLTYGTLKPVQKKRTRGRKKDGVKEIPVN